MLGGQNTVPDDVPLLSRQEPPPLGLDNPTSTPSDVPSCLQSSAVVVRKIAASSVCGATWTVFLSVARDSHHSSKMPEPSRLVLFEHLTSQPQGTKVRFLAWYATALSL